MEQRCELCRFWPGYEYSPVADCRRHAPVVFRQPIAWRGNGVTLGPVRNWPQTGRDDWCGEFEPRPTKEADGS